MQREEQRAGDGAPRGARGRCAAANARGAGADVADGAARWLALRGTARHGGLRPAGRLRGWRCGKLCAAGFGAAGVGAPLGMAGRGDFAELGSPPAAKHGAVRHERRR